MRSTTRLVSVMAANNVIGTIQRLEELRRIAHAYGALFYTDAVQATGRIPLNVRMQAIDLLSLSAALAAWTQRVGALCVRAGVR